MKIRYRLDKNLDPLYRYSSCFYEVRAIGRNLGGRVAIFTGSNRLQQNDSYCDRNNSYCNLICLGVISLFQVGDVMDIHRY